MVCSLEEIRRGTHVDVALVLLCFWFLPLELVLASREKQMREL